MKLPLWFKDRNGKYHTLTHYPDGAVGMPSEQADNISFRGDGLFYNDFTYDPVQDRYLLRPHTRNQLRNRNQET